MSSAREQIIQATCELLERQGYHATGMNAIVQESGAPKGSLYYYFPAGKEELVEQAIAHTTDSLVQHIRTNLALHDDPADAVSAFVVRIAESVEASGFAAGGPLTAVAIETAATSERLNLACRAAFADIQSAFAEKLMLSGLPAASAGELAVFITAAIEGGVLLSRAAHSGDPLRTVAALLAAALRAASSAQTG